MPRDEIGGRLHDLRARAGMSARELDRLAGLTQGHVSHIESTKGSVTSTTLVAIAAVFGASLDWLVLGDGAPPGDDELATAVEGARRAGASEGQTGTG